MTYLKLHFGLNCIVLLVKISFVTTYMLERVGVLETPKCFCQEVCGILK